MRKGGEVASEMTSYTSLFPVLQYVCDGVEQVKVTGWFGGHVVAIGERKTQAEDGQVYAILALSFSHICHFAAVEAIAAEIRGVVQRGQN